MADKVTPIIPKPEDAVMNVPPIPQYTLRCRCTNCGQFGTCNFNKGVRRHTLVCPNCQCLTLKSLPRKGWWANG